MRHAMKRLLPVAGVFAAFLSFSPSQAAEKVKIAIIGGTADVGVYLADAKGWFAQEGIEVEMVPFDSGARMIAPMSTGEIDVGTGAVSAGLYNAFDREITMRIVADKGRNVKGMSFQGLMVRKALVDSGAVKTIKDLKGRKVAFTGPGANDSAVLTRHCARKARASLKSSRSTLACRGIFPPIRMAPSTRASCPSRSAPT